MEKKHLGSLSPEAQTTSMVSKRGSMEERRRQQGEEHGPCLRILVILVCLGAVVHVAHEALAGPHLEKARPKLDVGYGCLVGGFGRTLECYKV